MKVNKKRAKRAAIITAAILVLLAAYAPLYVLNYEANLAFWRFIPTRLPQGFTVTAHTGCEGTELNSLASLKAGYESGAEIVEFDLFFDDDGTCLLAHDKPEKGKTYPTLEEAFIFLSDKAPLKANLDLRTMDNMPFVYELIKKYDLQDRVFFTGANLEQSKILRAQCPGIDFYLSVLAKTTSKEEIDAIIQSVKASGAVGINVQHSQITKKVVDACHENGILVSIYTVDKPVTISHVLLLSPDNITTRRPTKLIEVLSTRPNILP